MAKTTMSKVGLGEQGAWGVPERKMERQETKTFFMACELSPVGGLERDWSGV